MRVALPWEVSILRRCEDHEKSDIHSCNFPIDKRKLNIKTQINAMVLFFNVPGNSWIMLMMHCTVRL